jgi:hypothetical protein
MKNLNASLEVSQAKESLPMQTARSMEQVLTKATCTKAARQFTGRRTLHQIIAELVNNPPIKLNQSLQFLIEVTMDRQPGQTN